MTVTGKVLPARAGVPVTITRTANKKTATTKRHQRRRRQLQAAQIAIGETSDLRAAADEHRLAASSPSPRARR